MKLYIKLILLIIFSFPSFSQPIITYSIPDIATPEMAVYFEIIGPNSINGNFGNDIFSLNNPGDPVRILPYNLNDTNKIVFGPLVVSWNGRMISSSIFIKPGVEPNSWDWSQLNPEFRIPFRVFVDGKGYSNVDTIYIVKPYPATDWSNHTENVIGQSMLGKRSRRGAMIFESLVLGDKEYLVSVNDCDPISEGNQGYLPFTLLVKKELKGGTNTSINISGGFPSRQDAGPGGGGGGGRFCDGSSIGDDGGNGFVPGGPGGRNSSGIPFVDNVFKNYGQSSGRSNSSLNGVPPPPRGQYEAAGGGTGHPFGLSGEPCFDGNNCEGAGGYGAGAANKQLNDGGSAGYYSDGIGPFKSAGKAYGNTKIVPVAGGSGGASGNPQGLGTCSGNGGGGGGAISVFAKKISNLSFISNGADGGNQPADGGGGSGGAILTFSKLPLEDFKLSVNGGKAGSNNYYASPGRIRIDALGEINGELTTPINPWRGFATDTSSIVFRKFKLSGRKDFQKYLNLYVKPLNGNWTHLLDILTNPSYWSEEIRLPGNDSIYFLVAAQKIDNPLTSQYLMEPNTVLSQAAMNILKIQKRPSLTCDSLIEERHFNCEAYPKTFKTILSNEGDADLDVAFQNAKFSQNNQGFTLVTPRGFKKIQAGESIEIQVNFTPPNNKTYVFIDTLVFSHNDNFVTNPFKIIFKIFLDTVLITIQEKGKEKPITANYKGLDTIDLGKVCYVNNLEKSFLIQNYSTNSINLSNFRFTNNFFKLGSYQSFIPHEKPNNEQPIQLSLNITKYGRISDTMFVSIAECPDYERKFFVTAFIDSVALKFTGNSNFGNVNLGISKTSVIKIHNNGSVSALVNDLDNIFLSMGKEFKIISIKPDLPFTLKPYSDTLFVEIEFTPSEENSYQDQLVLATQLDCPREDRLVLFGRGVVSKVYVSTLMLDFGFGSKCDDKEMSFYIKNLNGASTDLIILDRAKLLGPDKANFVIALEPNPPVALKPGDSVKYYVRYTAIEGGPGVKSAYIEIPTNDSKFPIIRIDLSAEREDLVIDIVPNDTIDVGDIYAGFDNFTKLFLANAGRLDHYIFDTRINTPNVTVFPLGGWLNKNKNNQLEFDFKIVETNGGKQEYRVMFIVSNPCRDTLYAVIRANSILSVAAIPDKINYGVLSPCETKTISFVIENTSSAPFIIRSISAISGKDALAYKLTSKLPTVPDTVWMGTNRNFIVEVDPVNFPDGILDAYIDVQIYINGKVETRRIQLVAERKSGILVTPKYLDFGNVVVNTSKSLQLKIENIGTWEIKNISVSTPISFPTIYTVTPISNFDLATGNSRTIDITFQPNNLVSYPDSILIKYSVLNCPIDSVWVSLNGRGIPAKNFTIWLPQIITEPTNENLQIPIYAKLEKSGEILTGFNLDTLIIEYERSLFHLEKIINTNSIAIYDSKLDGNKRILTISLRNMKISDLDTVVAILSGKAMLGTQESTVIDITKVEYQQKMLVSKIDAIDGKLIIKYCSDGGDRFLEYSVNPFALSVSPNPTNGEIELSIDIIENGQYSIYILDNLGRKTLLEEISLEPKLATRLNRKFNLIDLPNGAYRLIIQAPNQISSTNLLIVR